ncbi:adhesion G-protein coupled receptor G4 [Melanotaenia boesemani]|uniref:adhesion G-protein coupled receptor G4 n=1 Tax=Melanotaenia boesemani TaxID=1250792 RepID=UPI001C04BBDC|nr:adhesion G-protein coupled receptor G4 [Melanotaenia boesemani]
MLKPNEWYSICITWSGRAQRLRVYINGAILYEEPLDPIPQILDPNGTLTLGVSHFVDTNGEVRPESGTNLLGEVGLFMIWSKEFRSEELRRMNCVDGDILSWDLRHWKYDYPPEPDYSLHCACSHYKIKAWTFIAKSTNPGDNSLSFHELTRIWLESIFPVNISVQEIFVSPASQSCRVVNNSAALYAQQPQEWGKLPNVIGEKDFCCEVYVNVEPASYVEVIQEHITELLSKPFTNNVFTLMAEPNSIFVLPVEILPLVTKPPPSVSSALPKTESATLSKPVQPSSMSTTEEPLDLNETAVESDMFFRVNATLNMTSSVAKPKDVIKKWIKSLLEVNTAMTVLNLVATEISNRNMKKNTELITSYSQEKQYFCSFHVQNSRRDNATEIILLIHEALKSKYDNGTFIIQTGDVVVRLIEPQNCPEDTMSTIYGLYRWAETAPQETQIMLCEKPASERASRFCKLNIENDQTSWADPDMTNCDITLSITDLSNVTVTADNAAEVVDMIQDLIDVQLNNSSHLSSSELGVIVTKLHEVVDVSIIEPDVGVHIVNIVADILVSETDVTPVSNNLLDLTDRMGNNMEFQSEYASLTAPALALSMVNVDPGDFNGLTFGVSLSSTVNPEVFVNQSFVSNPLPKTSATIALPSVLNNFFPSGGRNTTRVQFQFYGTLDLFQDPFITDTTKSNWTVNSYIVSASINNTHIINLQDRVVVTLTHTNPKQPEDRVQCMFWDFQKNSGLGGWNSSGCETQSISSYQTSCLCDHLTHFAVLLDVSRSPISESDSQILTVISFVGCGISSIFLGITLLTYLFFEKLRQDYPSKILVNLSVALLGLNMLFLLDSWLASFSNYGLCITTAATLHYFLLATFTWMGLEAVHMYFALVKVFNTYIPSYILKFCVIGWGLPLIIVGLVLAIDKDAYGNLIIEEAVVEDISTDPFCWLQNDVFFYVTVVAFVLLILLSNISVFIVVLIQIKQMKLNKPTANSHSSMQDLRAVASLTVLLGLTWLMGFFSFGPGRVVIMYLFSICNTLQGFFVFLFHCLLKENVRKQWRIHLCCGRFRLSDTSDWSRSVTVGGHSKKDNLFNSDSFASNNTSSLRSLTPPQN